LDAFVFLTDVSRYKQSHRVYFTVQGNYIYVKAHSANVLTQLRSMIFGLNKYHQMMNLTLGLEFKAL